MMNLIFLNGSSLISVEVEEIAILCFSLPYHFLNVLFFSRGSESTMGQFFLSVFHFHGEKLDFDA